MSAATFFWIVFAIAVMVAIASCSATPHHTPVHEGSARDNTALPGVNAPGTSSGEGEN